MYMVTAGSDIGISRENNEDSVMVTRARLQGTEVVFSVLCDGMGGHQNGEIASSLVLQAFRKWFLQDFPRLMEEGVQVELLHYQWKQVLKKVNNYILHLCRESTDSMGTTFVALLLMRGKYYVMHVGDSSVYCLNQGGRLTKITEDHTVVQLEVQKGTMSSQIARTDPRRHLLYQCVGIKETISPSFYIGKACRNDTFVLCSDGFTGQIKVEELIKAFFYSSTTSVKQMNQSIKRIMQLNKGRKELDNMSAAVIRVVGEG